MFFGHPVRKPNDQQEVTGEIYFPILVHTSVGHCNYILSALLFR
jgi:hypothetical protein